MKRKLTSLLVALALCLSILPITAYASGNLNYLALGDSITSGYGLNSSSDGFVSKLATEIDATTTVNLGKSGLTTAELLSALKSDSDYQDAVEDADVITITIGGNDLMAVLYQCITVLYNSTYGTSLTTTYIQAVLASPSLDQDVYDSILYLVNNTQATSYVSSFSSTISATVTNINSIVAQIRAANSDAVILVANQYNPYQWFSPTGDYATLKTLFSLVVSSFNSALSSNATSDCVVVGVASAFSSSSSSLTNADESTPNLDFHPNAAGHTAIANAMATAYSNYALTVSSTLTGLSSSNDSAIHMKGVAYSTTLTADTGYSLPDSVTVTVGGTTLTAGTGYTYDSSTGELAIPASAATGNIVITAAGVETVTAPTLTAIAKSGDSESEYFSGTWTASKTVVITASGSTAASGIAKYQWFNGDEWADLVGSNLTVLGESNDTYVFRAVSNNGSYSATSEFVVKNDTSAPTVSVSGDTTTILSSDTATITAADDQSGVAKVEVSADGGATYTDITDSYASGYTVTASGDYTFRVTNGAGTTATASITYTNIDTEAPVISGIADGETYCQDVTFTVSDNGSSPVSVTVNGQTVTDYTLKARDTYTVVATDGAGNSVTVTVTVNDDHTWNEGIVTKEPTCTEEGEKTYTCTVCGDTYTEAVPATGHGATEVMNAVEATCIEDGYTGDAYCSVCGELLEEGEIISATGHSYGEPVFTWSEDGKTCKASVTCAVCGDVQSTYATVTSAVKTAATATRKGVTTYTATVTVYGVEYTSTKDITDIPATGSSGSDSSSGSSSSADTGDSANLPLWVGLLLLSGTGMATMAVYSWKKRTK